MLSNKNLALEEKKEKVAYYFWEIMKIIWIEETESTKKTPQRVAKMYVEELFIWLDTEKFPKIMKIPNTKKDNYNDLILEKDIPFYSICEHHFLPIVGVVHIAYIPSHEIIWLSKLNRVVEYFSKKPQLQERCTQQIYTNLIEILGTESVAVIIQAEHMCVTMRGVKHTTSKTITSKIWWKIEKLELLQMISG